MDNILMTIGWLLMIYAIYLTKRNNDVQRFLSNTAQLAYLYELKNIALYNESENTQKHLGEKTTGSYYTRMVLSFRKLTVENWFPEIADQLNSVRNASESK